jgi:hypothetical protein
MAIDVVDQLTPSARAVPSINAVSDASIERVTVDGPPVSATSDEPAGFQEKVKSERAAFEAKGAPAAAPLSVEVKPEPKAAAAVQEPAQAAPAPAPAPVKASEASEAASEPVIAFPEFVPQPVLLDLGPKPEQGRDEDWREFSERQSRWAARETANAQKIAEFDAAVEKRNAEVRRIHDQALQQVALTWQDRKAAAIKERPDFEAVTTSDSVAIFETMANHIVSLDNGTDVAYHLGKHPAEARRIYDMAVARQIDAVARLSERLKAPAAATKATPASRTSSAPKPAAPQRPAAPVRVATVDLDKMSMAEFAAYRNEQLRAERRH